MKTTLALLSATAVLALSGASLAADETVKGESKVEYKEDGGYESTRSSKHVTPEGTTHATETEVDVDVDSSGRASKTVKTEAVTDPKGLMNKKKDTSKTEIEEKPRGGYVQTTLSKHTEADGTDVTIKTVTDVDVDTSGNITTTAKSERVVDPKGWLNETKTTSTTKTVNGRVVEQKKETN